MPQILEQIVEFVEIVDIPFLQIEFIFCDSSSFFVVWHGALHTEFSLFNSEHVGLSFLNSI